MCEIRAENDINCSVLLTYFDFSKVSIVIAIFYCEN